MTPSLQAGIARRMISPPPGIYLIGYGDRTKGNTGILDDLTATALALDDGMNRAVIVACDLLAINEKTVARVQARAGDHVLICCSHTHSGPVTYAGERSPRRNRRYVEYLVDQLVGAVREAESSLRPAALAWGQGEVGIAVNRRERKTGGEVEIGVNPDGVVDRSVGIVQVCTPEGEPQATVVNLACHNVVLGPTNRLVSADWAGAMRRRIERVTGAPCLFIQGATGDLNPDHMWGENDREMVEEVGGRAAEGVLAALDGLQPVEGTPVAFSAAQVWLPLDAPAETPVPPPTYRRVLAKMAGVPRILVDPVLNRRYPWVTDVEVREGVWAAPMTLTALRAGEVALVGFGMEVFTGIGLAVREQSPFAHTLFAGVSNGCVGYLPTAEEYALGGYEVDLAPYFYRLPGRLAPGAAERAIAGARQVLGELS